MRSPIVMSVGNAAWDWNIFTLARMLTEKNIQIKHGVIRLDNLFKFMYVHSFSRT